MRGNAANRFYKIEIIVRDSADDPQEIADDVEFQLGGYEIVELDVYQITRFRADR